MRLSRSYHPYAAVTILFWSMAFVFTRLALRYFSVYSLGLLRYLTASAVLLGVALAPRRRAPKLRDVPWFLLSGRPGWALHDRVQPGQPERVGLHGQRDTRHHADPHGASGAGVYHERLTLRQYAAIGVSFAGVVVLTVLRGGFTVGGGLWYMFASALSSAFTTFSSGG